MQKSGGHLVMNRNILKLILFYFVISSSFLFLNNELIGTSYDEREISAHESIIKDSAYTLHDRISISDDNDWIEQGWPGEGTAEDPYIIENLEIVSNSDCISIIYTSAHFIISDCLLYSTSLTEHTEGIHLNHVSNSSVMNCIIQSKGYGLYVSHSSNITIMNNTIHDNPNRGLRIIDVTNSIIRNNEIFNTPSTAVSLTELEFCNFTSNSVWNSSDTGVLISDAIYCNFVNNTIRDCYGDAIYIDAFLNSVHNITLANNTLYNNDGDGIGTYEGVHCSIINNSIYSNVGNGICLNRVESWVISGNNISNNHPDGVLSGYSINCTFSHNSFTNNSLSMTGSDLQYWMHTVNDNKVNDLDLGYLINSTGSVINGNEHGQIILVNCNDTIIQEGTIENIGIGVGLFFCNNCTLNATNLSANQRGIYLYYSQNCNITDCVMIGCGIMLWGSEISNWIHDLTGNTVNGKPIGYYKEQSGLTVDGSVFGQVIIIDSIDMTLENGTFSSATQGVSVVFSSACTIRNNILKDNYYGVHVYNCTDMNLENNTITHCSSSGVSMYYNINCTVTNTTIHSCGYGLYIYNSSNSEINTTHVSLCTYGLRLRYSSEWNISLNRFYKNYYGLYFWEVDDCTFRNNTVLNSTSHGGYMYYSTNFNHYNDTFSYNLGAGLYYSSTLQGGDIIDCTFSDNGGDGLSIWTSDYFNVINNTMSRNTGYGIMLHHFSEYNVIYGNILKSNIAGNGYCYESENTWDDGVSLGNYWDDYFGPGSYVVPGPGGCEDRYPIGLLQLADHGDIEYLYGASNQYIVWNAYSTKPDYCIIWKDDVVIHSDNWNGLDVTQNITGLAINVYNYTIFVNETSGNSKKDTVIVTVYDATPIIDSPSNIAYHYDTVGHSITWNPIDNNPDSYEIFKDNTLLELGNWNGSSLSISIDGLAIGEYIFMLRVNDTTGNSVNDNVTVSVHDFVPILDSPADINYKEGEYGNNIFWNASDLNPDYYMIFRNGSEILSAKWDGLGVQVSIDGLSVGVYNYTIHVNDTSDQTAYDTVIVTVESNTATTTTTTTNGIDIGLQIIVVAGISITVFAIIIVIMKRR